MIRLSGRIDSVRSDNLVGVLETGTHSQDQYALLDLGSAHADLKPRQILWLNAINSTMDRSLEREQTLTGTSQADVTPLFLESTPSEKAILAKFRDNTALVGLSVAMMWPGPVPTSIAMEAGSRVVEAASTTSEDVRQRLVYYSASTSQLQPRSARIPTEDLALLWQTAGIDRDISGSQEQLSASLVRFLSTHGSLGLATLSLEIRRAPLGLYDQTAALLASLVDTAGEAEYREQVVELLTCLLESGSPALRYEAAFALSELGTPRGVAALDAAAEKESSKELKALLMKARKSILV